MACFFFNVKEETVELQHNLVIFHVVRKQMLKTELIIDGRI